MTGDDTERWLGDDEYVPLEQLAPGDIAEFEGAVWRLREILDTIEDPRWHDGYDVADVEEAIEMDLPVIQQELHEALDDVRRTRDV